MYRTLLVLFAVFGTAFLLVALTFSRTSATRADYVFGNGTEPKTLDPQKMTGVPEGRIADALYEGLTYRETETLKPVPGQAESWTPSPDGLVWTFKIRDAARWSNGDKVTARDFVYAWKRLQEPESVASEYAYLLHMVRHAEAYNTFGPKVQAAEKAAKRFEEIAKAVGPQGLPVAGDGGWKAYLKESELVGAIGTPKHAGLRTALATSEGTLPPEVVRELVPAIAGEAARVRQAYADAKAHFGVDQGVFAPDEKTFVVELNSFTPYFLELTAFYPTFPVHPPTVEKHPDDFFKPEYIVTNGPFRMSRWRINERIRMEKNPDYWGADQVRLRTVDALPIENRTTLLNLYLTGEVDWAPTGYPPDLISVVKQRPDYYTGPGMVVYYYRLNCTRPHLADPRVRRAIGLGFDRSRITERVLGAGQVPTTTFVAPGIPAYESPPSRLGFDVETARRLLAEAGYPGGKGFPKLTLLFNTDEGHKKIADYVAEQLGKNLGIEVNPTNQEWQSYQEDTRRLKYDIARAAWVGDYRDPNTFLDMWLTDGGNNQTGWGDPFYDRLIKLAADPLAFAASPDADVDEVVRRLKEPDRAKTLLAAVRAAGTPQERVAAGATFRFHLFREAEAILLQDAFPVCPIYFYVNTGLVSPRVHGFHVKVRDADGKLIPNLQDLHPFREVFVDPPTRRGP
jgi:oligopeptide transport system substrate-binding protein